MSHRGDTLCMLNQRWSFRWWAHGREAEPWRGHEAHPLDIKINGTDELNMRLSEYDDIDTLS